MGHQHLGTLSRSRKWREVIELISAGANVEEVAAATSAAAEQQMGDASSKWATQVMTQQSSTPCGCLPKFQLLPGRKILLLSCGS